MANEVFFNVYQIGQRVLARDASQRIGFPTVGLLVTDCSASPTRSLSSNYNVYGAITFGGQIYYVQETVAQLATAIG